MDEGSWTARLRWRMRGATQWPAFAVALVAAAVLLQALPPAGDRGPGLFGALLLSGFMCLVVVAVAGPLAGAWLRRRRPELPRVVAVDHAATVLLLALVALVAVLGVLHRPVVLAAGDELSAQSAQVRRYVLAHAPARFRANVGRLDVWKQGAALYRTCVPGPDPRRSYCVIVDTARRPPGVTRDPDQRPNGTVAGPGNPGRRQWTRPQVLRVSGGGSPPVAASSIGHVPEAHLPLCVLATNDESAAGRPTRPTDESTRTRAPGAARAARGCGRGTPRRRRRRGSGGRRTA